MVYTGIMTTITLCMIVKNEAKIIERCLDSVVDSIDSYVIIDTGSTDDTMNIIRKKLGHLPGTLWKREWVDFEHNRNEVLEIAKGYGDYLLLMDADMTIDISDLKTQMYYGLHDYSAYSFLHSGDPAYRQKLLVKNNHGYRFVGKTHEVIVTDKGEHVSMPPTPIIHHFGDGGSKADKFTRDLEILSNGDMDDARTVYYLARTYECMGKKDEAIIFFEQRSKMGGFEEEAWHAQYTAAKLRRSWSELMRAWERRTWRLEPLYVAVNLLRESERYQLGYVLSKPGMEILANENLSTDQEMLFVERHVYDWALVFEHAILAYYNGDRMESKYWNDLLLQENKTPALYRRAVESNLKFLK